MHIHGLGAGPPAIPVSLVRDLLTAERDARVYAATIGLLCVLAQDLRDVMVPEPSEAEDVVALAADLASGSLNGRDSGGSLIQIGSSSNFLSECPDSDLIDASAQLGDELSGLRNLLLQAIGGGTLTAAAPGDWNTFYWDTADWQ
ncbi:MAG: hypothetical protein OSA48_10855 [Akkermansiaceae bacterium]|nr:hypothetical protein [Akkermansiaceae bacterium]